MENKILTFNDIGNMLTGNNPPKYRKIGSVQWVKTWKDNGSIYAIGQLENGKYFWAWNLKGKERYWSGILCNLDNGDNEYWYGTGGFVFQTLEKTLKSIQFDEMFAEELYENEGVSLDNWKDHPFYIWAKENFKEGDGFNEKPI